MDLPALFLPEIRRGPCRRHQRDLQEGSVFVFSLSEKGKPMRAPRRPGTGVPGRTARTTNTQALCMQISSPPPGAGWEAALAHSSSAKSFCLLLV